MVIIGKLNLVCYLPLENKIMYAKFLMLIILLLSALFLNCEKCSEYGEVFESTCLVNLDIKVDGENSLAQINAFELPEYYVVYDDNASNYEAASSPINEVIAIFKNKPEVSDDEIMNKKDILLIWHTGYKNLYAGETFTSSHIDLTYFHNYSASYTLEEELASYKENISITDFSVFEAGTYYLVAWAWDNEGILQYSSKIQKFTVSLGY